MKKALVILSLALMALTSCTKEDKFSLSGKTFAAYAFVSDGTDCYFVWKFDSDKVEISSRISSYQGGIIGNIEHGNYTLDYPSLTVNYSTSSGTKYSRRCTFIDKTTFRCTWTNIYGEETFEFIQQ